ncbi:MAG: GAF domain-containing protein, partial [Bacteroidota bacterium]|nr:GAF domain-containing protein [Bacteroidota bacterium]
MQQLTYKLPSNEIERLAVLRRYEILDTPPDGSFDRITSICAKIFNVPIALVTLVDEDRIWFKSRFGLDAEQVDREEGLCASAIMDPGLYVVNNAALDARTLANPLVAGELGLRFYAAAPLRTHDGFGLGNLCIIDKQPREFSAHQLEMLQD